MERDDAWTARRRRGVRRPRAAHQGSSANGHTPGLGTILVGDDGASERYIRIKHEKAAELGFESPHSTCREDATQADLLAAIREFNDDPAVDGFLVQHPTPPQIDYDAALLRSTPTRTSTACTR